jgi:hypothetical protein
MRIQKRFDVANKIDLGRRLNGYCHMGHERNDKDDWDAHEQQARRHSLGGSRERPRPQEATSGSVSASRRAAASE